MKTNKEIYQTIEYLNKTVKDSLKKQGVVVPLKKEDGTIQLGKYLIQKVSSGFYNILDYKGREIVHGINLPQTAVIVANKLALGKWIDTDILQQDKKYGFAYFDEIIYKKSQTTSLKKKNYDRAEIMQNKFSVAKHKKEYYKNIITLDYRKLLEFR